jgi:hypothetical protein
MTDLILISVALLMIVMGFISNSIFYRVSVFMVAFSLLTMSVTKDLTTIFIMIVNALIISVLLLLSYKEYSKNDD